MTCPHCRANLAQRTSDGEPLFRNRGIILRKAGPALVCPRCRKDVPVNLDLLKAPVLLVRLPGHH